MRGIWNTWLIVWCAAAFTFGLVLALGAAPGLDGPARFALALLGGGAERAALLDQTEMRFGIGLQGALTMGWIGTIFALTQARETHASTWRLVTISVLIWWAVDSAISVATGFVLNAASNTLFVIGFLVPVFASGALRAR